MLTTTGDMNLIEASKEILWGTGVPIRHKNVLSVESWTSPGLMSKVLHRVREQLKTPALRDN